MYSETVRGFFFSWPLARLLGAVLGCRETTPLARSIKRPKLEGPFSALDTGAGDNPQANTAAIDNRRISFICILHVKPTAYSRKKKPRAARKEPAAREVCQKRVQRSRPVRKR
jgi:hypothetical protein